MFSLAIPALHSPFAQRINPAIRIVAYRTQQWVRKYQLHSEGAFERYLDEGLSWMSARFYPDASIERLAITDKFNTLLFALDDLMDHNDQQAPIISSRARFEQYIGRCMRILKGTESDLSQSGHMAALCNVWCEIKPLTTPTWQVRFIQGIQHMFDAALWAHDNNTMQRLPSIEEFYRWRPFLGAANTSTDMIEFCHQLHLTSSIRNQPEVEELTRLCQITVCLANDLFSLSKEIDHHDKHNMVLIVQAEKGLSLQEAILHTAAMHDEDVRRFEYLTASLSGQSRGSSMIKKYILSLTALMRGNIDWSIAETGRYHFQYDQPPAYTKIPKTATIQAH